jgi:hypothetical protein
LLPPQFDVEKTQSRMTIASDWTAVVNIQKLHKHASDDRLSDGVLDPVPKDCPAEEIRE